MTLNPRKIIGDNLTASGAEDLIQRLRSKWKGAAIKWWVEDCGMIGRDRLFCVRSDLLNGMPRKWTLKVVK